MSKSIRIGGGTVGEERGVAPAVKAFGILAIIAVAAAVALAGCAIAPKDAPQAAYEATTGFAAALKGANAYASLPRCAAVAQQPCSSQAIVVKIDAAAHKADIAVRGLQTIAADTKASGSDVQKAETAATDAVKALSQIVPAV